MTRDRPRSAVGGEPPTNSIDIVGTASSARCRSTPNGSTRRAVAGDPTQTTRSPSAEDSDDWLDARIEARRHERDGAGTIAMCPLTQQPVPRHDVVGDGAHVDGHRLGTASSQPDGIVDIPDDRHTRRPDRAGDEPVERRRHHRLLLDDTNHRSVIERLQATQSAPDVEELTTTRPVPPGHRIEVARPAALAETISELKGSVPGRRTLRPVPRQPRHLRHDAPISTTPPRLPVLHCSREAKPRTPPPVRSRPVERFPRL